MAIRRHNDRCVCRHDQDCRDAPMAAKSYTRKQNSQRYIANYNVSLPVGLSIKGIEVRIDAFADAIGSNTPAMCVQR